MSETQQALRGMQDILPSETIKWSEVEDILKNIVSQYGYGEIRTPILESLDVFKKIGESSDIIGKEMYAFADQNNEMIALRPEGTAGIVRAVTQHHMTKRETAKLWYMGPMFRYERPQKGRYRQFHQFGVELLGFSTISSDIEILLMNKHIFDILGVCDYLLELNFISSAATRERYKASLVNYLEKSISELDDDSLRRLKTNPLRILDSKDPQTQQVCKNAPIIHDYLSNEEKERFQKIQSVLKDLKIPFKVNPHLVRGLDYYNDLVFEFTSSNLGSQSAISAGGRFDHLIAQSSGQNCPAIGFSIGMERLISLVNTPTTDNPKIYAFQSYVDISSDFINLLDDIRRQNPGWTIIHAHNDTSYNAHMKKAQKLKADIIIGCNMSNVDVYNMSKPFSESKTTTVMMHALELINNTIKG